MSNIDYNNLSDEELAKLDLTQLDVQIVNDTDEPSTQPEATAQTTVSSQDEAQTFDEQVQSGSQSVNADESTANATAAQGEGQTITSDAQQMQTGTTTPTPAQTADTAATTDTADVAPSDTPSPTVDYKAFYERMTTPFKANGREISVTNVEDAIALMQQGANYSKKMAQLKPNLAVLKKLEEHGLNNPDELGYLIDLYEKNPEAIAKLIKDANIDLYSFDTEQAAQYTPKNVVNVPTATEEVINDLYENTPEFREVIADVSAYWDDKSKEVVQQNPQILQVMAQQAQSGLYRQIINALDYERMLGRMVHTPFLQAYSELEARILGAQQAQPMQAPQQSFSAPRPNQDNQTPQANSTDKRQRAGTPTAAKANNDAAFDPLQLSDEEFLKYFNQQKFH